MIASLARALPCVSIVIPRLVGDVAWWPARLVVAVPVASVRTIGATSWTRGPMAFLDFGPFMAAAVLTLLPTVILFAFLQRAFVRGITRTGIK